MFNIVYWKGLVWFYKLCFYLNSIEWGTIESNEKDTNVLTCIFIKVFSTNYTAMHV